MPLLLRQVHDFIENADKFAARGTQVLLQAEAARQLCLSRSDLGYKVTKYSLSEKKDI